MLNRQFIGSQLALVLGISGMLGGITAISEGGTTDSLFSGPVMVLGAAAYSSRKRRLLGLKPGTAARKTFEGICLALVTAMWLGLSDLGEAIATSPVAHLVIPVWALIAYPCASFRIRPELRPSTERTSSSRIRTVLWSMAVAVALSAGGIAVALAVSAALYEPPAFDRLDQDGLFGAAGFRCSFAEMGLDMALDAVIFEGENRFGAARLIGNNGTADVTAVRALGDGSLSFIEITPGGSVHLLTVYALRRVDGAFEAVYSRHAGGVGGFPIASHDEGPCRDVW